MKAVTWHGVGDVRLEDVPQPQLQQPTDAIVRILTSAICGTDLHLVRGTVPGMRPGTVMGHEAIAEVVETGEQVRNLEPGDRVVVASTIGCGSCAYCLDGYYAQCDRANPHGPRAGAAYFGGPESSGGFDGLQAEYARIPYANVGLVPIPEGVDDEQALMVSDILPTAWFGGRLAEIRTGDTVAIFGCGPVGQLAIMCAYEQGASRVIAVDHHPDRLAMAKAHHAEVVDFGLEDPVAAIANLTEGVGTLRSIDAVGVDAQARFGSDDRHAPGQALHWAVAATAKAGSVGIIGVYPPTMTDFPVGLVMNRNLTVKAGNCNHRRYTKHLLDLIAAGTLDPSTILTQREPIADIISAYQEFDQREPGWIKVAITPPS